MATTHPPPSRPQLPPSSSTQTSGTTTPVPTTATSSKPPLTISPSAHLDHHTYALGSHPIQIQASTLIHPRARLISTHCPLFIDEESIVTERCVVGGPAPDPTTTSAVATAPAATRIGKKVHLHPSSTISHSVTIGDYSVVESHVTILPGITIGSHSKICARNTVSRDVGAWEVVYSNGSRRKRKHDEEGEMVENVRLLGLDGERVGSMQLLKQAQMQMQQSKVGAARRK